MNLYLIKNNLFNFYSKSEIQNTETYKYKKFKDLKCQAFIKLKKGNIDSFFNQHNHLTNDL